jgi:hypothetical protein
MMGRLFDRNYFGFVDDIQYTIFKDLPDGIPVSEYPELSTIESCLDFDLNDSPSVNINRMDKVIRDFFYQVPSFSVLLQTELLPEFNKLVAEYDSSKDMKVREDIVNNRMIPFFSEWVLFTTSQLFLNNKMKSFLLSSGIGENESN